ncbi:hypothetical protein Clacol_009842 [Clathrus columnatus]|uniref:Rhodanese domain-containing protein n=1 Tax=Clathrus columnatus TaxID=1419009 RepID=A0AAV5AS33_9AGAM|nr:hypothetical protein Clacol_009842 [Clathrus columnatus]
MVKAIPQREEPTTTNPKTEKENASHEVKQLKEEQSELSKELYALIKSSKVLGKDYVVVDVRDEDFIGGNIRGCLHVPSQKYDELFGSLYSKVKDVPTIIFHCAYSQARSIYAEKRSLVNKCSEQHILVLQGGFAAMQAMYKVKYLHKSNDKAVIEGWDKSLWEYEFF